MAEFRYLRLGMADFLVKVDLHLLSCGVTRYLLSVDFWLLFGGLPRRED